MIPVAKTKVLISCAVTLFSHMQIVGFLTRQLKYACCMKFCFSRNLMLF